MTTHAKPVNHGPVGREAIEALVLRLRRCKRCGYRLPDPQATQCSECGQAIDWGSDRLYLYGIERGWSTSAGTAGGWGWLGTFAAPILMVLTNQSWPLAAKIAYFAALATLSAGPLLKRFYAAPDALVVAYVDREGFSQQSALSDWPLLDVLFNLGYAVLFAIWLFLAMPRVLPSWLLCSLATFFGVSFVLPASFWRKRSNADPLDLLHKDRGVWRDRTQIAVTTSKEDRIHLRINRKGSVYAVNIDFPGDAAEAADLRFLIDAWQREAVRTAAASPPPPPRKIGLDSTMTELAQAAGRQFRRLRGKQRSS